MPTPVRDDYREYFAEKLWEWLPAVYRELDRLEGGDALRALLQTIAEQAALLKRSQDRLWDDAYIELASDWAVPYIGELLGTRLLSNLNPRGRRADVAKTIYYRRRKGTVAVLEQLIFDIAQWRGKVVEEMRRLGRMRHGLDGPPKSGRVTGTAEGGLADMRAPRGAYLAGGPFDEFHYTPDFRRAQDGTGRRGISKLSFYLYRLTAVELAGVTPRHFSDHSGSYHAFTFDPSGREVPLFCGAENSSDWGEWQSPEEWQLPCPISLGLLRDAAAALFPKDEPDDHVRPALELSCGGDSVPGSRCGIAPLESWALTRPGEVKWVVDPERGRFLFDPDGQAIASIRVRYHVGMLGALGAGAPSRRAVGGKADSSWKESDPGQGVPGMGCAEIIDSATYRNPPDQPAIRKCTVRAAGGQRPYLRLSNFWRLGAAEKDAALVLDGLWVGSNDRARSVVLEGTANSFGTVTLRYCTLDPGGVDANGGKLAPVSLVISGVVDHLVLDSCILSDIRLQGDNSRVNELVLTDCIVQAGNKELVPIDLPWAHVSIIRSTVVAQEVAARAVNAERLYASDSIVAGIVRVSNTQDGCFRFSAAAPGSSLPHPYRQQVVAELSGLFASRCFGQPHYFHLSGTAPLQLRRGAENGCEMGAYNSAMVPVKLNDLLAKIDEYMPFGRTCNLITQT